MKMLCEASDCLDDATHEIVLDDGQCLYSCKEHIARVIEKEAQTENPVHEIIEMD